MADLCPNILVLIMNLIVNGQNTPIKRDRQSALKYFYFKHFNCMLLIESKEQKKLYCANIQLKF